LLEVWHFQVCYLIGETEWLKVEAIAADDEVVASAEVKKLQRRIRELERVLGKKTLENEILKDAVEIARQKKLISQLPSLPEDDTP
jgi:transposase